MKREKRGYQLDLNTIEKLKVLKFKTDKDYSDMIIEAVAIYYDLIINNQDAEESFKKNIIAAAIGDIESTTKEIIQNLKAKYDSLSQ